MEKFINPNLPKAKQSQIKPISNTGVRPENQELSAASQYENDREIMEALVEHCLIKAEKCNEGKNAVIYQINLEFMPEEFRNILFLRMGEIAKEQVAGKVLKIFIERQKHIEAANQQHCYEIIEAAKRENPENKFASIPQVIGNAVLQIKRDDLLKRLQIQGVNTAGGEIEIILMDFIKGKDIITYLYEKLKEDYIKEMEKRLHKGIELSANEDITYTDVITLNNQYEAGMEFKYLEAIINKIFNYQAPKNSFEESTNDTLTRASNLMTKINYRLKKMGICLKPEIYEKILNSLNALHAKGIYHNDIHERNIMLEIDGGGEIIDVYLIDFDKVSDREEISDLNKIESLKYLFKKNNFTAPVNIEQYREREPEIKEMLEGNDAAINLFYFFNNPADIEMLEIILPRLVKYDESLKIKTLGVIEKIIIKAQKYNMNYIINSCAKIRENIDKK